jgi:hypothetical protein
MLCPLLYCTTNETKRQVGYVIVAKLPHPNTKDSSKFLPDL